VEGILGCFIWLIFLVIMALIVVYVFEAIVGTFLALPPPVGKLIRLLIGLLVLLYALQCLFGFGAPWPGFRVR
jgi:ABC-type multidrug transport system fused ATPase/permease subunit